MKRLPKNYRYVKQLGYDRLSKEFSNWAIFSKSGTLLGMGNTKVSARQQVLSN